MISNICQSRCLDWSYFSLITRYWCQFYFCLFHAYDNGVCFYWSISSGDFEDNYEDTDMPPPVPSGNRRPSVPSVPQYDEEQENCKYHNPPPLSPNKTTTDYPTFKGRRALLVSRVTLSSKLVECSWFWSRENPLQLCRDYGLQLKHVFFKFKFFFWDCSVSPSCNHLL